MVNGNRITGGAADVQSVKFCKKMDYLSNSFPYQYRNHHHHQYHPTNSTIAGGVMGASGKVLFTATQWEELERQKRIYMYIMASVPIPPQLLLPLSNQSNRGITGLRLANGSDPEPWRCRRTDGKKWRCSKDVAPDQKYCERHAHKTRSRSRKPVETQSQIIKEAPFMISAANQETRCGDWFLKNSTIPVSQSNQFQQPITDIDSWSRIGAAADECSLTLSMQSGGNETDFDHDSFQMAVGLLSGDKEPCRDIFKRDHQWLNQSSWVGLGSGSGSGSDLTPGGPLGEALCLGITSTRTEPYSRGNSYSTSTSGSCDGGGGGHGLDFSFVNPHDD